MLLASFTTDFHAVFNLNQQMKYKRITNLKQTDVSISNWYCKDKHYFSIRKIFTQKKSTSTSKVSVLSSIRIVSRIGNISVPIHSSPRRNTTRTLSARSTSTLRLSPTAISSNSIASSSTTNIVSLKVIVEVLRMTIHIANARHIVSTLLHRAMTQSTHRTYANVVVYGLCVDSISYVRFGTKNTAPCVASCPHSTPTSS